MATKSARELAKKTSDVHSLAPKLPRCGWASASATDVGMNEEVGTVAEATGDTGPQTLAQVLATLRVETADANNLMRTGAAVQRGRGFRHPQPQRTRPPTPGSVGGRCKAQGCPNVSCASGSQRHPILTCTSA